MTSRLQSEVERLTRNANVLFQQVQSLEQRHMDRASRIHELEAAQALEAQRRTFAEEDLATLQELQRSLLTELEEEKRKSVELHEAKTSLESALEKERSIHQRDADQVADRLAQASNEALEAYRSGPSYQHDLDVSSRENMEALQKLLQLSLEEANVAFDPVLLDSVVDKIVSMAPDEDSDEGGAGADEDEDEE